MKQSLVALLAFAVAGSSSLACGSSPETSDSDRARGGGARDPDNDLDRLRPVSRATLIVENPGDDSWDLRWHGGVRGNVAARSEMQLVDVPPGPQEIEAVNERLGLSQTVSVHLAPGKTARVTLPPVRARVIAVNRQPVPVEILVDGVRIGRVEAASEVALDAPAGRRLVLVRRPDGPGAVRLDKMLRPDVDNRLEVPELAASVSSGLPTPPAGQGLLRMRNAGRLAVTLWVDGRDQGLVAPGGLVDVVLAPGTHAIEVRMEGLEAKTSHTVSLVANQVAEWSWEP